MTTNRYSDISDVFGSGGANLVPGQGVPSLRDVLRSLLAAFSTPYADSTALTASLAKDRVDGQVIVKLDDYTKWTWKAAATDAADTTHIIPTDVGSGAGRWVREDAIESDTDVTGYIQHVAIDVPLATLQGQTSGAAFNVGAALPANAQLLSSQLQVLQVLGGGTVSAASAQLQNTGETAGAIEGGGSGVDVHTATGKFHGAGSNPFPTRDGQQLQLKVTTTGDTMAHLTTGHLQVDLFYTVLA